MSRKNLGVVGLGVALAVAVGLLAITLLVRGNDSTNEAARDTSTNGRSPEIPDSVASSNDRTDGSLLDHGPDLDVYTLAWDELIEESDMVVVGVVVERGQDQRIDAGNPSLTAVAASYDIAVEQSLKGDAEGTLTLTKIVGYDVSGEESDTKEAYSVDIDSANSIKVGSRYVLAVIQSDGRWYATAEPFRFRLEGGEAVAESGMLEDAFLEDRFPARSETDLISDVESIVAAQAAEAAAR